MADVAVISVIASGTVGVLGAAGGIYAQRVAIRIDEHRRGDAWRDDVRSVLDAASQAALAFDLPTNETTTVGAVAYDLDKLRADIDKQLGRIGVRLGPSSEAFKQYADVRDGLDRVQCLLADLPRDVEMSPTNLAGLPAETLEALTQRLEHLKACTVRFLAAAADIAGRVE